MNTIDCIFGRRSIRQFTEEKVKKETLENIIAAASLAPSWKNTQITRYIAIENENLKNKIADETMPSYNTASVKSASLLIAVTVIKGRSGFERDGSFSTAKEDRWQMFDCGVACQTFCLAAYEYGIGTVIMGIFDDEKAAKLLEVPEDRLLVGFIAAGHPNVAPEAPKRKSVQELLEYI